MYVCMYVYIHTHVHVCRCAIFGSHLGGDFRWPPRGPSWGRLSRAHKFGAMLGHLCVDGKRSYAARVCTRACARTCAAANKSPPSSSY